MIAKKLLIISSIAVAILASCCVAQVKLPRKVLIGVGLAPINQAQADANKIKIDDGIIVTKVIPKSTAESIGIKTGDIITSLNRQKISSTVVFVAIAGRLDEGAEFAVEVISDGAKKTLKGTAKGKPKETSSIAEVRYDAVKYKLGKLRTIVHIPKNRKGKLPAIFYLQGYPCQSQEFSAASQSPIKKILNDWVKAGFVVYRVERPNIGDSRTTKDCRDIDFAEELEGNRAAYKALLKYDFVDKSNVFLFGHSLGSYVAPFLTKTHQPKGIVVYGSVLRSWFEYFIDIYRVQRVYFGTSRADAERDARTYLPALYEWLEKGKSPEEMKKSPELKAILEAPNNPLNVSGNYFFGRHYKFWHTMNKKRLSNAWSKVKCKVLSAHGEFDVQAINDADARNIAKVVNEANSGNGEFLLIPETEHIFLKAKSYQQIAQVVASGGMSKYAAANYNPEVAIKTIAWMNKTIREPS